MNIDIKPANASLLIKKTDIKVSEKKDRYVIIRGNSSKYCRVKRMAAQPFPFEVFCSHGTRKQSAHKKSRQPFQQNPAPASFFLPPRPETVLSDMQRLKNDCVEIMRREAFVKEPMLPIITNNYRIGSAIGSYRRNVNELNAFHTRPHAALESKTNLTTGCYNQISNLCQVSRPASQKSYLHRMHDMISRTIEDEPVTTPHAPEGRKSPAFADLFFKGSSGRKYRTESTTVLCENKENIVSAAKKVAANKENKEKPPIALSKMHKRPVFLKGKFIEAIRKGKENVVVDEKENKGKEKETGSNSLFNLTFGKNNKLVMNV